MSTKTELVLIVLLAATLTFPRTVSRLKSYLARGIQDFERESTRPTGSTFQGARRQNLQSNHGRRRTNQQRARNPVRVARNAGHGPCSRREYEHLRNNIQHFLCVDAWVGEARRGDQLRCEAGDRPVGVSNQAPVYPV
jgi:hypothetical protein